MRRLVVWSVLVGSLLLMGGCGALWHDGSHREPFQPDQSDSELVFVRTGDRSYYYVIDKERGLCFFHARMYGRDHLVEMDCHKLPEYREITGQAPPSPHDAQEAPLEPEEQPLVPQGEDLQPAEPAPASPDSEVPQAEEPEVSHELTNEERNAYRRAYVQFYCSQRREEPEPLHVILSRHGLDQATWRHAQAEFSEDRDLWDALTSEAMRACP